MSPLVSSTKWSYPLHTLISQQELHQLLAYSTSSSQHTTPSSSSSASSSSSSSLHGRGPTAGLEWRRRTLQNLCMSVLHHGEVRPCLELAKSITNTTTTTSSGSNTSNSSGNKPAKQSRHQCVRIKKVKLRSSSVGRLVAKKKYEHGRERKSATKPGSVHYSTFVISNSIECRRLYQADTMAELQLQKMAKGVYSSILLSLLNARPLSSCPPAPTVTTAAVAGPISFPPPELPLPPGGPGGEGGVGDVYLERLMGGGECRCLLFPETVSMLVCSLEHLLRVTTGTATPTETTPIKATPTPQPPCDVDLLSLLSLWHEVNEMLVAVSHGPQPPPPLPGQPAPAQTPLTGAVESEPEEPCLVNSESCCMILVDYLLAQSSPPSPPSSFISSSVTPAVWQASMIHILSALQHHRELCVDYDKLLNLLVRFLVCCSAGGAAAAVVSGGLVGRMVSALLGEERRLVSGRLGGTKLSGTCLLLDVLITALQKR